MVAVKVCGLTRVADAVLAADLGASAIGCVFWDKSPRFVAPSVAARIREALPSHVAVVGVFVNSSLARIEEVRTEVGLNGIQLHGNETQEFCESLSGDVIRAVTLENENDLDDLVELPKSWTLLLDAHDPVRRGGTGRVVNWTLAARLAARRRLFLAGGLKADNIAEAVRMVRPYGVDISSGLESQPGVKCEQLMKEFFSAMAGV
tara:strand:+ start:1562 stop:2176 length:615 start_codon:yes stop_codon:yes gene_type:complete